MIWEMRTRNIGTCGQTVSHFAFVSREARVSFAFLLLRLCPRCTAYVEYLKHVHVCMATGDREISGHETLTLCRYAYVSFHCYVLLVVHLAKYLQNSTISINKFAVVPFASAATMYCGIGIHQCERECIVKPYNACPAHTLKMSTLDQTLEIIFLSFKMRRTLTLSTTSIQTLPKRISRQTNNHLLTHNQFDVRDIDAKEAKNCWHWRSICNCVRIVKLTCSAFWLSGCSTLCFTEQSIESSSIIFRFSNARNSVVCHIELALLMWSNWQQNYNWNRHGLVGHTAVRELNLCSV